MLPEQSLREGKLDDALAQLQDQVRKHPADSKYRIFLFQLLAVLGDWKRALTQLNVLSDLDDATLAMVQTYREAIRCELLREEIFAGKHPPLFFGEPQPWMALLVESLRLAAEGDAAQSQALRDQAFEGAPVTAGAIDGKPFQWIADADMRLGPIIEAVINGGYYWLPVHNLKKIDLVGPEDLRDFVWTAAYFTLTNGGQIVGLIPTRYAGSATHADPQIKLARRTDWIAQGDDVYFGAGQRMLTTDAGDYPLLDVRCIELTPTGQETADTNG